MALLDVNISTRAADVVAVIDASSGQQVFPDARPMKITVTKTSKMMTHPLEDGASVVDHRIILPMTFSLQCLFRSDSYRETYQIIQRIFENGTPLLVQTKTDTYRNLFIQDMPHEESIEMFDSVNMILQLVEAKTVSAQLFSMTSDSVIDDIDSSTVDRGEQTTVRATSDQESSVLRAVSSWFS